MHRLAPYVFHRLRVAGLLACLSPSVQNLLQLAYYASTAQNILLAAELNTLLTDFRRANVDPIVLKGMALGVTLYPVPSARPVSDLDLLIERGQMEAVRQVLTTRGYRDMGLDPEHHRAFGNHLHAWRELIGGRRVSVEVHWNLVHDPGYARSMDLPGMRDRARRVDFGDFSALVLDPADQLIYACAHLLLHHSHNWSLLWLLDLRLLVDCCGSTWDWHELVARAEGMRLAGALSHWLGLTETWFGPCLPEQARRALAETQAACTRQNGDDEGQRIRIARGKPLRVGELLWLRARGAGGWRERLAYLAETLFPPWSYMQQRYRARRRWLAPLYYSWRVARAVVVVFRRVGRDDTVTGRHGDAMAYRVPVSPLPHVSVSPCPPRSSASWLPLLREALAREGRFRWRLHGDSMAPTLPPDCEIEIAPLPSAVQLGELVVFVAGDHPDGPALGAACPGPSPWGSLPWAKPLGQAQGHRGTGYEVLVAHRLVRRVGGRWITQGDGRRTPDPPLDQAQALGIVTAAYQGSRRCWPHPLSRLWALFWIARHHLLRMWRASRRLSHRLRSPWRVLWPDPGDR